jgi:hypothetical protein
MTTPSFVRPFGPLLKPMAIGCAGRPQTVSRRLSVQAHATRPSIHSDSLIRVLLILRDMRSFRRHGAPNKKGLYLQARTVHQPICEMAVIGLVAVGLLGCGFMLYALVQWMQETVRKD